MIPWIRGWGADVEVLGPEGLREMMMGEVRRLAEAYGWHTSKVNVQDPKISSLSQTFSDFFGD
jgi:CRISPR-associated endonuclease/helicase Cas3